MIFTCCESRRLEVLRRSSTRNAIDFLEVLDHAAPATVERQRTLFVRLLRPMPSLPSPPALRLTRDNVRITGGDRIPVVEVEWVAMADELPAAAEAGLVNGIDELPSTLVVRTRGSGDFSRYTLRLVASLTDDSAPDNFDRLLSSIEFSFKVECPADFDCAAPVACEPAATAAPRIDYLAKDYAGFRRLMMDRLSLLTPGWTERTAADLGVTLVELLAFAADNLSYRQDVVANEAYLNTARQRVSVRRHARLVDYRLHEGCNARAFVHFRVTDNAGEQILPVRSRLLTRALPDVAIIRPGTREEKEAFAADVLVFETVRAATLHDDLNELTFHTWGDVGCCLPKGATRATLLTHVPLLARGDFLLLEEARSPTAHNTEDADRMHRHVVRLTRVEHDVDPSGGLFRDEPEDVPEPITRIEWDTSDALPFPLCISVLSRPGEKIGVARGNLVLADHGETRRPESLPLVPTVPDAYSTVARAVGDCCDAPPARRPPLRYRPMLAATPLAHGFDLPAILDAGDAVEEESERFSAAALRSLEARAALPLLRLREDPDNDGDEWFVQHDLLASGAGAKDFTVEVHDDGRARLRFGDDARGRRPDEDTEFAATYRIGNGAIGNVGADAIAHLVTAEPLAIAAIGNPIAAFGGVDSEDIEVARRDAPQAFRTQERAVTAADYARVSERRRDVQRAEASFRWTGSWHTVFVTADRVGGADVDATFETGLRRHLEPFRMAGYDLEVDAPRFVPLDLSLHVCVKPDYFRAQVLRAVRTALSGVRLPDGSLGAFHPDNFSFGQPVYASRIIAAAQSIAGVESVRLDRFQRLVDPGPSTLENGVIPIGRLEIARLDNDPNHRERGRLTLSAGGGE
jgi:hypothetical protein